MRLAITIAIVAGFAAAAAFVVLYAVGSPDWRKSPVGQNLMALPAVLGTLLGMWIAGRAFGPLPLWLWLFVIAAMDAVMWWRVVLLWHIQHRRKE